MNAFRWEDREHEDFQIYLEDLVDWGTGARGASADFAREAFELADRTCLIADCRNFQPWMRRELWTVAAELEWTGAPWVLYRVGEQTRNDAEVVLAALSTRRWDTSDRLDWPTDAERRRAVELPARERDVVIRELDSREADCNAILAPLDAEIARLKSALADPLKPARKAGCPLARKNPSRHHLVQAALAGFPGLETQIAAAIVRDAESFDLRSGDELRVEALEWCRRAIACGNEADIHACRAVLDDINEWSGRPKIVEGVDDFGNAKTEFVPTAEVAQLMQECDEWRPVEGIHVTSEPLGNADPDPIPIPDIPFGLDSYRVRQLMEARKRKKKKAKKRAANYQKGLQLWDAGKTSEAIARLTKAAHAPAASASDCRYSDPFQALAKAYEATGEWALAVGWWEKASESARIDEGRPSGRRFEYELKCARAELRTSKSIFGRFKK